MAYNRFLLLLIGLISSYLHKAQGRPIDFWCNNQDRKSRTNRIEGLKKDMADCVGSETLPSPIQIPCVWVHPAEWANKTLQQRSVEVLGALQGFQDRVQEASKQQTTLQCQTSLLKKLESHIRNDVDIVQRLHIQNGTYHSVIQYCFNQTSLKEVLEQYRRLLSKKLERLATDLHDSMCKAEHRSTNTKGP
uniref:Thrombopoietin n=1 Tax=Monopterus albus TaxID=43700 RepID=A0A3Q3KPE4_MONAL